MERGALCFAGFCTSLVTVSVWYASVPRMRMQFAIAGVQSIAVREVLTSYSHGSCWCSNLVDSASSDTLSLRTKPCMCKYAKYSRLRMAHYISYSLFDSPLLLG